jgi:hypothetical protein
MRTFLTTILSFKTRVLLALLTCVFACVVARAQTITADVGGTVTDASGAIVPQAKVTAINVDTNVAVSAMTNGNGIYSIRFLQIGQYKIVVEAGGFDKSQIGPFALESGQIANVSAKLKVGSTSTTVDVAGAIAPLLNTENGTLDTIIDANTISNIPLNGANFSSVTLFLPGSVETQPSGFTGSSAVERSTGGGGEASINGGRNQQNNYLLDGVEINETINNTIGYNPYPDALEEIRVISANAPAEFGNVNGGDVLMVIKSGTNDWHGSASFNLEDYVLDGNTWGNKHVLPGTAFTPKSPYTQSIFGGTFGGPILKNKLFFFADFLATRYHSGGSTAYTVLSSAMRLGDFSELLNPAIMCSATGGVCASQSSLIQLYDPENGNIAFNRNKIPISNPVFAFLAANPALYPMPNHAPGANSPVKGNFVGATSTREYNEQGDIKVDYTPTKNDRISTRYTQGEAGGSSTSQILTTFPGANTYPDKGVAINYVRTITPSLVNEFRGGFTRIRWKTGIPTDPSGQFGLTGEAKVGIPFTQPYVGFSSQTTSNTGLSNIGTAGSPTIIIDNTFSYSDDLTWQRGKHLIKGGVQLLRYQQNQFYAGNQGAMGIFTYNGNFTSNPNIGGGSATVMNGNGYDVADFALDRVYTEGVGAVKGNTGQRQWRDAFFLQDDWTIAPSLTLNLGLRYEYDQPIYEANNKQANVLPGGIVEFAGSIPANAPANSIVCPTRACYNASKADFAPRLGFAYQVRPTLVIRGGYGLTDYMEGTGANLRLFYNPPFEPSFLVTGNAPSTTGPGNFYQTTAGFNLGSLALGGTTYRQWQQNLKPGVIGEYSLTTEYQLNNFSSFKIGYIGESGQHLILAGAGNQLTTPCFINGVISSSPTSAACQAVDPAPYAALVGQSGSIVATESRGMMNYNALQATYRQRAKKGLEYTINYTYGRAMTNTVGFFGVPSISGASAYANNYYNNPAEYGPVGQDVRNNLNATGVYALPFGRGRAYLANDNRFLDLLIGGWKGAMTAIVYSGFPVTINASSNNAYTANKSDRANQVSNVRFHSHTINNWWGGSDTTDIAQKYAEPTAGTYGNAKVGSERGPGFQDYDMSVFKDFVLFREQKIGFRCDFFNAFNIASLSNPTNTQGSTTIGQITAARSNPRQIQFAAKYQF